MKLAELVRASHPDMGLDIFSLPARKHIYGCTIKELKNLYPLNGNMALMCVGCVKISRDNRLHVDIYKQSDNEKGADKQ